MIQTYSLIKTDYSVINHLKYEEAKSFSLEGDLILTIKDNHISAIRKVTLVDMGYEIAKECEHIEGNIIPYYQ